MPVKVTKVPPTTSKLDIDLNQRDPFVSWEVKDVQFPSQANTDYVIRHGLQISNPHDVHYRVIKQFTNGTVYESAEPTAKAWGSDFVVLRSDVANWTGRIMLGVLNNVENFNIIRFNTPTIFATNSDAGIALTIDGNSAPITTGYKNSIEVPFDCTITHATLLSCDNAVTSGSIVVDVWKDIYGNYPPTVADKITGSTPPTLSSATKSIDTTLSGWTTTITSGDILGFNVNSVSGLYRVTLILGITKT